MNTKELRKKNTADLKTELEARHKSLKDIRFGKGGKQAKNTKAESVLKKEVAQIMTLLNELSMIEK